MRSGPADTHTKMVKRTKRSISETDIIRTCFWRRKLASYCVSSEILIMMTQKTEETSINMPLINLE